MKRLILLVLTVLVGSAMSWGGAKIGFEYSDLDYDESLLHLQIQLKKRDDKMVINIRAEVFRDVTEPIMVDVAYYEKVDNNYLHLMNATVSACNLLSRTKAHPIMKIILKELLKNSNIPTMCPIKKGVYYLKDFMINDDLLPPILPTGQFMALNKISRLTESGLVPAVKITWFVELSNDKDKSRDDVFKLLK